MTRWAVEDFQQALFFHCSNELLREIKITDWVLFECLFVFYWGWVLCSPNCSWAGFWLTGRGCCLCGVLLQWQVSLVFQQEVSLFFATPINRLMLRLNMYNILKNYTINQEKTLKIKFVSGKQNISQPWFKASVGASGRVRRCRS